VLRGSAAALAQDAEGEAVIEDDADAVAAGDAEDVGEGADVAAVGVEALDDDEVAAGPRGHLAADGLREGGDGEEEVAWPPCRGVDSGGTGGAGPGARAPSLVSP